MLCVRRTEGHTQVKGGGDWEGTAARGPSLWDRALSSWLAALTSSATGPEGAEGLGTGPARVPCLLAACLSGGFLSSIFLFSLSEKGRAWA